MTSAQNFNKHRRNHSSAVTQSMNLSTTLLHVGDVVAEHHLEEEEDEER